MLTKMLIMKNSRSRFIPTKKLQISFTQLLRKIELLKVAQSELMMQKESLSILLEPQLKGRKYENLSQEHSSIDRVNNLLSALRIEHAEKLLDYRSEN